MMTLRQTASYRLFFALAGSALASLITFAASPLALQILDETQFAHLAIWAIFLIFVQILDFGYSQLTIKMCSKELECGNKIRVIEGNNHIIYLFLIASIFVIIFVPKPSGEVYKSFGLLQWVLFKISIILNLKIIFNQSSMIVLNKQSEYTINQIYLAFSRFILPIFVYFYSQSLNAVLVYYIIITSIFIVYTDRVVGINTLKSIDLRKSFIILRESFSSSFALYSSASIAILLSVMDRMIASKLLYTKDFVLYAATFSLASAVNIVVLPFYRIFIGRMYPHGRAYNQKNALRISSIQSYVCLFSITFLCLYSDFIIDSFDINYPIDFKMLVMLSLSLWGAANGWIIASEIMLSVKATFQAYLILCAIIFYAVYILFQSHISIYDISIIWVIHGVIQTFICPVWISSHNIRKRYIIWIYSVVIFPIFVIGVITSILYWIGLQSQIYSIIAFFVFFISCALIVSRGSAIKKAF